jgi:trehalose 6-phosphate phosphatase
MRYLQDNWNSVRPRLRAAKTIALFLDFDGTLAPLQARPEEVQLPPATRRVLRRLASRQKIRLWVVSGRRQADVCRRIAVPGIHCLGLYGWENGGLPHVGPVTSRMLAEARARVARGLDPAGGLWIEDKGVTFALHYRAASPLEVQHARAAMDGVRDGFGHRLNVAQGDHVWEVMPRALRGKGHAVRHHLHHTCPAALPVYIGDDAADEAAFLALSHGITACVGPARLTHAKFRLRDPLEVCASLEKLDREAARG